MGLNSSTKLMILIEVSNIPRTLNLIQLLMEYYPAVDFSLSCPDNLYMILCNQQPYIKEKIRVKGGRLRFLKRLKTKYALILSNNYEYDSSSVKKIIKDAQNLDFDLSIYRSKIDIIPFPDSLRKLSFFPLFFENKIFRTALLRKYYNKDELYTLCVCFLKSKLIKNNYIEISPLFNKTEKVTLKTVSKIYDFLSKKGEFFQNINSIIFLIRKVLHDFYPTQFCLKKKFVKDYTKFLNKVNPLVFYKDYFLENMKNSKRSILTALNEYTIQKSSISQYNRESTSSKAIPIFFACNNTYFNQLIVAITSIKETAKSCFSYLIYILYTDLSQKKRLFLESLSEDNIHVICYNISDIFDQEWHRFNQIISPNKYRTKEIFFKFFIPSLFPQYDKVIYLDCDVLVKKDLLALYAINLGKYSLGACRNLSTETDELYVRKVLNLEPINYINAGVLLLNNKCLKKNNLFFECIKFISKFRFIRFPDQDAINEVFSSNLYFINNNWNLPWNLFLESDLSLYENSVGYMMLKNISHQDCSILHFTSKNKPWNNIFHPLSKIWGKYVCSPNFLRENEKYTENKRVIRKKTFNKKANICLLFYLIAYKLLKMKKIRDRYLTFKEIVLIEDKIN